MECGGLTPLFSRAISVATVRRWGGASGPAAHPHRRAGDVAPYLPPFFIPQLLSAHTRQHVGSVTKGYLADSVVAKFFPS